MIRVAGFGRDGRLERRLAPVAEFLRATAEGKKKRARATPKMSNFQD